MSERKDKKGDPNRVLRCDECENLIADAIDGTLSAADAAALERHRAECPQCAQLFKETEQGRNWMQYLTEEPEIPEGLFEKILARTSQPSQQAVVSGAVAPIRPQPAHPAWYRQPMPVLRQVFEPRLLMTAAMAFFSIALTLNLTGIKLTEMHASDLRPSRMKATLTRQYYSTNEQVMKYYENLRVVYEMESRVRELRRSTEQTPAPGNNIVKPPVRDGSPSSTAPKPQPVPQGRWGADEVAPLSVSFHATPESAQNRAPGAKKASVVREGFRTLHSTTEGQAKRSLV